MGKSSLKVAVIASVNRGGRWPSRWRILMNTRGRTVRDYSPLRLACILFYKMCNLLYYICEVTDVEPIHLAEPKGHAPKGQKDSAWGFNPRNTSSVDLRIANLPPFGPSAFFTERVLTSAS